MTGTTDQIRSAIAAIEAEKPDIEVDFACFEAFGGTLYDDVTIGENGNEAEVPNFCHSLDAIMAEMPDDPQICWRINFDNECCHVACSKYNGTTDEILWIVEGDAPTEQRARLLALLRAMEAQADAS